MATIREKIQKLLALATSPNENEARSALVKAKELMAKHKLTEADFEAVKDRDLKRILVEEVSWTTDSGRIWMVKLCKLLCDNYCCSASWFIPRGTRTHKLVIVGLGDDTRVCEAMVKYAVGFVNGEISSLQKKYRRQDPKAIANSYADGFLIGLEVAFEAQQEEHPEWGLVVTKPEEVLDYENGLGTKAVKTKKSDFNPLAYMRGQVDGENFNKQKVLEG